MTRSHYTCSRCGSADVQCTSWVLMNTDKLVDGDGPTDQTWCPHCDDEVDVLVEHVDDAPCELVEVPMLVDDLRIAWLPLAHARNAAQQRAVDRQVDAAHYHRWTQQIMPLSYIQGVSMVERQVERARRYEIARDAVIAWESLARVTEAFARELRLARKNGHAE